MSGEIYTEKTWKKRNFLCRLLKYSIVSLLRFYAQIVKQVVLIWEYSVSEGVKKYANVKFVSNSFLNLS